VGVVTETTSPTVCATTSVPAAVDAEVGMMATPVNPNGVLSMGTRAVGTRAVSPRELLDTGAISTDRALVDDGI
jgi:hypothetical protein